MGVFVSFNSSSCPGLSIMHFFCFSYAVLVAGGGSRGPHVGDINECDINIDGRSKLFRCHTRARWCRAQRINCSCKHVLSQYHSNLLNALIKYAVKHRLKT